MTQLQHVQKYLIKYPGYCDDCIGRALEIDRHRVNAICNNSDEIQREKNLCKGQCSSRLKFVNSLVKVK